MSQLLIAVLLLLTVYTSKAQVGGIHTAPALSWKFTTGGPVFSSPVIEQGKVYVGSNDGNVYCLDLATGMVLWKYATSGEIRSTVCINGDQLIFISGDGNCYSLHRSSGQLAWKFATNGEKKYSLFSFADYYQSTPVMEKGVVYFGSGDGNIYALNAADGRKLWSFPTGDVVHGTPAVSESGVYAGSFDGFVYCLDPKTGQLKWKFKSVGQSFFPMGEMQGSAVEHAGKIFIASRDYNLYAIDVKGGYAHWNRRFTRGWAMGVPKVYRNTLFVGTSDDYEMHAIEPGTGRTLWKTNVQFNIFGGMGFRDSIGYFGNLMGRFFAVGLATGDILWSIETDGSKQGYPQYFKAGNVYRDDIQSIIRKNEDFYTLYLKMGAIFSTPGISGEHIVFSSLDGNIYCLKGQ